MRNILVALSGAALACSVSVAASAQIVPDYGNYTDLKDNFRIGVQVFNPVLISTQERSFEQSSIEDITDYLDPSQISAYLGAFYTPQARVSEVFDIRGAPVLAGYAQNSSVLTLNFVSPETGATLLDNAGQPCAFSYNNGTRQASFDQFDAEVSDGASLTAQRITQCLGRAWSQFSPIDPLVGNPYSLQGNMARTALDLTDSDSLVEQRAAMADDLAEEDPNSAGDPWVIGATFSTGSAGRFRMSRVDARVAKGWRVLEGNRARLKLDMPFSYTSVKGASAYTGQFGLALEVPIKANWSLEPRVAYGIAYSGDQGSLGHILQASLASRYAISGVGRGRILFGNMVGYSFTLKTPGDINLNPDVKNWVFRNGAAYELPLKLRVADRATSLRASYVFTNYAGNRLYNNNFHELTLSFGLRGRDDTPKAIRDVIRLNFNTIQARGFSTYTVGLGFRF